MNFRSIVKAALPKWIRVVLRSCLHYVQRLGRWPIILWQVRGASLKDQWVLMKSAAYAPLVSLRHLMAWQDPVLLAHCTVQVEGYGRFQLRPHCDDLWHVLPWREQAISNLLKHTLKPGEVFIDAGANIGVYTMLAARLVGPSGKVISVEMMPDTADRLELHIRMNGLGNVRVIRNALSDNAGQTIIATVQEGKYGQATIAEDSARYGMGKQISVQTTTLDAIAGDLPRVRLMKVDLEGVELAALHGGASLLRCLYAIVYESWGWKRAATDPVGELLRQNGFELHQLDGNNRLAVRSP